MKRTLPVKISEVLKFLEERAPRTAAEHWDNVGHLVGDAGTATQGAVVSVDLTLDAIQAAKERGYKLIVTHHPCIFPKGKGPSTITAGSAQNSQSSSQLVFRCIREGISVISVHTNFDQCALEVVEAISGGMQVTPVGRILEKTSRALVKLVVFVPETHLNPVREAITHAGAGQIGRYDQCTFAVSGTGQFRAGEGTNPFLGSEGKLEVVKEARLETVLPRSLLKRVLAAMHAAHPYEEVAYDLYPVEQGPAREGVISGLGYGFYGNFVKPVSAAVFKERVKKLWGVKNVLATHPFPAQVRSVAFTPGKGSSFVQAVAAKKVDVFVTGELGYHSAMEAARFGVAVIELGHRESELFYLKTMSAWMKKLGLSCAVLNLPTQKMG